MVRNKLRLAFDLIKNNKTDKIFKHYLCQVICLKLDKPEPPAFLKADYLASERRFSRALTYHFESD